MSALVPRFVTGRGSLTVTHDTSHSAGNKAALMDRLQAAGIGSRDAVAAVSTPTMATPPLAAASPEAMTGMDGSASAAAPVSRSMARAVTGMRGRRLFSVDSAGGTAADDGGAGTAADAMPCADEGGSEDETDRAEAIMQASMRVRFQTI